ncbi:hypothetical protein D3C78_950890 [compost metagenome]
MRIRTGGQIFSADVQRTRGVRLAVKIRELRGGKLNIALTGGARRFAAGHAVRVDAERFRAREHTVLRQRAGFNIQRTVGEQIAAVLQRFADVEIRVPFRAERPLLG